MPRLLQLLWGRHANPLSVWTRLLSTPLAFAPWWNHSWVQGLGVIVWFVLNPFIFPPPKRQYGWAARAIAGERLWLRRRAIDASLAIQGIGTVAFVLGFTARSTKTSWEL